MKCPKCNKSNFKYIQDRKEFEKTKTKGKKFKRTDYSAKCNRCGYQE